MRGGERFLVGLITGLVLGGTATLALTLYIYGVEEAIGESIREATILLSSPLLSGCEGDAKLALKSISLWLSAAYNDLGKASTASLAVSASLIGGAFGLGSYLLVAKLRGWRRR